MKEILDKCIEIYIENEKKNPSIKKRSGEHYLNIFNTGITLDLDKLEKKVYNFTLETLKEYLKTLDKTY